MQDFRNLKVWQTAHELALHVYTLSRNFPKSEQFNLTSQIRRSATSIPANLAEGCGRSSDADFSRFIYIAFGSACEFKYHILLAKDLGYINEHDHNIVREKLLSIKRMLSALLIKLKPGRRPNIKADSRELTADSPS
ncbi:MAG: four helix bundle protein [Bdellovibrionaceae bacterium]|nr:four helix bundle protein [Pseudobdellovibrionaceae bacterium]